MPDKLSIECLDNGRDFFLVVLVTVHYRGPAKNITFNLLKRQKKQKAGAILFVRV